MAHHTVDVVLHLYDLSMGMARSMSPMLIGKVIDYIPHTGVCVFGHEYFFSGGIQVLPPHRVVEVFGLAPIEKTVLGRTSKTEHELRDFLRTISARYTMTTYDLFRNNCNHFSSEVTRFLLGGVDIPPKILAVPGEVLSTPMGQSLAAMWGQMQGQMNTRMAGAGTIPFDPFAARAASAAGAGSDGARLAPEAAAAGSGSGGSSSATDAALRALAALSPAPAAILASHTKPLLSSDPGAVQPLVDRLLVRVQAALPDDSPHRLSADEASGLAALPALLLQQPQPPAADAAAAVVAACGALAKALRCWPRAAAVFPALALLRLLVLREDCIATLTAAAGGGGGGGGLLWDVLETVTAKEAPSAAPSSSGPAPAGSPPVASTAAAAAVMYGSHAANVMALGALANAFKTPAGAAWAVHGSVGTRLIDAVSRALAGPAGAQTELRQMAAAVAYNLANALPVAAAGSGGDAAASPSVLVTDASVQLLGSLLEGLDAEPDAETQRRRLLAAGRLVLREGGAAAELVVTLGLDEAVRAVAGSGPAGVRAVAAELLQLLAPPSPAV